MVRPTFSEDVPTSVNLENHSGMRPHVISMVVLNHINLIILISPPRADLMVKMIQLKPAFELGV